jgi:hypothetical protein
VWYALFRHHPCHYLGGLLWAMMGGEETERLQKVFELFRRDPLGLRAVSLRLYVDQLYYNRYSGSATLPEPNRLRWSGSLGTEFHEELRQRYTQQPEEFERDYGLQLAGAQETLHEIPIEYVVEIGCGNGLLMERVAAQAPASGATFVGLDMDAKIIAANRERYRDSRVQYHCCSSLQEFLGRVRPASVLVLAHGTFQCFTEAELAHCLRWLVANIPGGAVVVRDFTYADGQVEIHSRPAGSFTFCHNYEQLFAQAGFEAIRTRVAKVGANWKGVVVSARWTRPPSAGTS